MNVFVFPGQGSQFMGMGSTLFDEVEEFRTSEHAIDEMLGYSIRQLCLRDPEKKLSNTQYTQPALFVVNALHYYKARAQGLRPDLIAGHSLGEYNALLAAGTFDLITGLRLVKERGRLMAQASNGSMAAIIGIPARDVTRLIEEHALTSLDVANFNAPTQTVISGPKDEIMRVSSIFLNAGASAYVPLPVSAAFHSRYMSQAAVEFARYLSAYFFKPLSIPVISNVTAKPYPNDSSSKIRELLVRQISSSVQWTRSVNYLLESGAISIQEVGPGNVLSRLIDQIKSAHSKRDNVH